jgi:hypothetical protein
MAEQSFHELFLKHWDAGSGLVAHWRAVDPRTAGKVRPRGGWTTSDFINAMNRAGCELGEDSVERYRNGSQLPRRPSLLAILDAYFPESQEALSEHVDRQSMYDAWLNEQTPKRHTRKFTTAERPDPNAAEWPRENPKPFAHVAALELFTPTPDNKTGYVLRGRLDLGMREDESGEKPILLALRNAYLRLETSANLVTDGSLIGVREPHEHLEPIAGELRVVKPRNSDGCLVGEVFGGCHIAVVTPTDNVAGQITVTVSVPRSGFHVAAIDASGGPVPAALESEAKRKVLDALVFATLPVDGAGRAILQSAVLWRRGEP